MSEADAIPDSWITVKVSDIGSSITGNTPSTKHAENYGGSISYIKPPQLIDRPIVDSKETLSEQGAKVARILPPFSVLVSCIGNLGKTGINKVPVGFNQQINAIVPFKSISSSFLFYQSQSHSFRSQLESKATATTISIVNKGNFDKVELNVAPLNEQHRIVAKIEELFSELEKGVESLKRAREQLKVYRQSVLKAAFEGRLTESWREERGSDLESATELLTRIKAEREARYAAQLAEWQQAAERWEAEGGKASGIKKPTKPKKPKELLPLTADELADLSDLPEGWGWIRAGNLFAVSSGQGLTASQMSGAGFPVYGGNGINGYHGEYIFDEPQLIIGRVGVKCGVTHITKPKSWVTDNALVVSFEFDSYDMKFFQLKLQYENLNKYSVSTAQPVVSGAKIYPLALSIPSLQEQHQIVQEIESRFSVVEKMEQTIEESLQKAEALRQSILKRAFEGKLVPQDPTDEPAFELLARIKAEREAATNIPKRGRKKA